MGLKFTEYHDVTYYECDFTQTMTLPMLIASIIKTSESQSYRVNLRNPNVVEDKGLGWIITNYDIHINRLPRQNERIFITTQADTYNKFFCYRHFWVYDEEGNKLVQMVSSFVLMDLETRKIVSLPQDIITPYQATKTTKVHRFEKIPSLQHPDTLTYRVRVYDLDGNKHVNNAKYFDWMLDPLGFDFLTTHYPTDISIQFDKEVEYGSNIISKWEIIQNKDQIHSLHQILVEDTLSAEAKIIWKYKND